MPALTKLFETVPRLALGTALCAAMLAACGIAADSKRQSAGGITRIEITSVESPTFGGKVFGAVGAYEKLRGKAFGELDPDDPRNALITDIALAPRNPRGNVEYSTDIYILKPIDLAKGNHQLFVEVNNRGN